MISKKKLGEIFLRKDDREKRQKLSEQLPTIDQSYFQCSLIWQPNTLSLIKVQAKIIKGDQVGQFLPLNCKWYTKTKFDFKEIEAVKASYYQPCLDDIGATICVQIDPFIEGKIYNGVTIMKQTGQLKLPVKLESQSQQLLKQERIVFRAKVQAIFSQNPKFQFIEYPLQCQIVIEQTKMRFIRESNRQQICCYIICQNFPEIQFIRKSFNSILISLSTIQSMRISFPDNYKRDLYVLIVKNIMVQGNISKNKKIQQQIKHQDPQKNGRQDKKEEDNQASVTLHVLKIQQLNRENQNLKKQYQELLQNYHIERQSKLKIMEEFKKVKEEKGKYMAEAEKYKESDILLAKQSSENRFLGNENSLLKKDNKVLKQQNIFLQHKLQHLKKYVSNNENGANNKHIMLIDSAEEVKESLVQCLKKLEQKNEKLQEDNEKYQKQIERLEDEKCKLKKKIDSLVNEKQIISPQKTKTELDGFDSPVKTNLFKNQIQSLQKQVKNLEMLLKYKSGQKGNEGLGLQQIINRLTENITEKEVELESIKNINKQLLRKINENSKK